MLKITSVVARPRRWTIESYNPPETLQLDLGPGSLLYDADLPGRFTKASDLRWHWKYHCRVLPAFTAVSVLLLGAGEVAALVVWCLEHLIALLITKRRRG